MINALITKVLIGFLALVMVKTGSGQAQTPSQSPNRYRTFLFGVDYYPEQWSESLWEQDAKRMQECGVNTVRIGEFAWALMEPREGIFDFSLFDRAIAVLAKPADSGLRRKFETYGCAGHRHLGT